MKDSRKNLILMTRCKGLRHPHFLMKKELNKSRVKKNLTILGRGRSLHIRTCGHLSLFVTGSIYLSVFHCLWIDFL